MRARLEPIKTATLPFTAPRYEMISPMVQGVGDIAILTFNLTNYGMFADGTERVVSRWNATEGYRRTSGTCWGSRRR